MNSLSVFFPCYNEEKNVEPLTEKTHEVLSNLKKENQISDFEILIVNDGSKDKTREKADELQNKYKEVRVINHEVNQGYGGAVKTGIKESANDLVFFTDGDGQFDISEISKFIELINQRKDLDAILGYRINRQDGIYRYLLGHYGNKFIRFVFGMKGLRDIDCAFKIFRRPILDGLDLKSKGALISTELLTKLQKKNYNFIEIGVNHLPCPGGKQTGGSVKVIGKAFKDLFKLYNQIKK